MKDNFMAICSTLLFDPRFFTEGERIIKLIFDDLIMEAVEYYVQVFQLIPIEVLNP